MATTFLTKNDLMTRSKQTNKLDKLYEQLKANAEFNKVSEVSFEDAMKRQYKPIVETIEKKLEPLLAIDKKLEPLLAIEGAKKGAISIETQENVGRMTNVPTSIFESYMSNGDKDEIYGITKAMDDSYYLGRGDSKVPLTISDDRKVIGVGGVSYDVTSGLMELLTSKSPNDNKYTEEDLKNYRAIMNDTNIINSKAGSNSKKRKWINDNILSLRLGSGVEFLPSNTLSLYNMLNLRLAAYKAGNKGLRNEVIAIADELLRQGAIKPIDYKKIANIVENAGAKARKKS